MKLIIHSSTSPWNKIQVKLQQEPCLRLECQSHHHVLLVCRVKKWFFFFFCTKLKGDEMKQIHPFCIALSLTTLVEALYVHSPRGWALPPPLTAAMPLPADCLYSCGKLGYTSKSSPKAPHGNLLQWDVRSFQSGSQGRAHLMNLAKVKSH